MHLLGLFDERQDTLLCLCEDGLIVVLILLHALLVFKCFGNCLMHALNEKKSLVLSPLCF